jgi:hypothetical protein
MPHDTQTNVGTNADYNWYYTPYIELNKCHWFPVFAHEFIYIMLWWYLDSGRSPESLQIMYIKLAGSLDA